jgi:hypothetical protein
MSFPALHKGCFAFWWWWWWWFITLDSDVLITRTSSALLSFIQSMDFRCSDQQHHIPLFQSMDSDALISRSICFNSWISDVPNLSSQHDKIIIKQLLFQSIYDESLRCSESNPSSETASFYISVDFKLPWIYQKSKSCHSHQGRKEGNAVTEKASSSGPDSQACAAKEGDGESS